MDRPIGWTGKSRVGVGSFLLLCAITGCAVVSSPVVDGIPVRRLPPEAFAESKNNEQRIPLTALRQPPPTTYKLGPGDVLGIWIEGVLGERNAPPPVRISETGNTAPALGFPFPIRDDGTIPLPLIDPPKVEGMTLAEAQTRIIQAYTEDKQILKKGQERIVVTLMRPRQYRVLVLREDAGGLTFSTGGGYSGGGGLSGNSGSSISETFKTTGYALELPAYENDVLNALTRSGGLPGPEAVNEVTIERGAYRASASGGAGGGNCLSPDAAQRMMSDVQGQGDQTIRIPMRVRTGEPVNIRPQDIILKDGDVVLVRIRRGDFFYTAGLLPSRVFPLPRDRDLDILQALTLVGAPLLNGATNANNITGQLQQSGLGFPSPSQVTVVRKTANGSQIPILVDVNRAFRDPRERILVKAGDVIVMQQSVNEGIAQYMTTNLQFNIFSTLIRQRDLIFTGNANAP